FGLAEHVDFRLGGYGGEAYERSDPAPARPLTAPSVASAGGPAERYPGGILVGFCSDDGYATRWHRRARTAPVQPLTVSRREVIGGAIVLVAVAAGSTACHQPAGGHTAADIRGWRRIDLPSVTQSPGNRSQEGELADVAAISPTDIWAVGSRSAPDNVPLALH